MNNKFRIYATMPWGINNLPRFLNEKEFAITGNGKIIMLLYDGNLFSYVPNNLIIQNFTGLQDNMGTDIYEGDILTNIFGLKDYVSFQCGCFILKKNYGTLFEYNKKASIIGNIFENPELLK